MSRRNIEIVHSMVGTQYVIVTSPEIAVVYARAFANARVEKVKHVELPRHEGDSREKSTVISLAHAIVHNLGKSVCFTDFYVSLYGEIHV